MKSFILNDAFMRVYCVSSDRLFIRRVCRRGQSGGQSTGALSSIRISRLLGATEKLAGCMGLHCRQDKGPESGFVRTTRPESRQNGHKIRDLLHFCLPERPRKIRVSDNAGDGCGS